MDIITTPICPDSHLRNNRIPIKTIHPNSLLKTNEINNKHQNIKETKKFKKTSKSFLFNPKSSSKQPYKSKQDSQKAFHLCRSSSFFMNNENIIKSSKNSEAIKKLSNSVSAGIDTVPPIPPRIPLKRSLSLTHHQKPLPYEAPSSNRSSRHIPISFPVPLPFIVDPLNPRRPATTLARSAPTLSTINTGNQLLLFSKTSRGNHKIITSLFTNQDRRNNHNPCIANLSAEYNDNHQNIISLARWPITNQFRNNQQLTIDTLAGKVSVTPNEYIESPKMYAKNNKSINHKLISNLTRNSASDNNSFSCRSNSHTFTNSTSNHINNDGQLVTHLSNINSCMVLIPTVSKKEKKYKFFRKFKSFLGTQNKSEKLKEPKKTRNYSFESSNEANNSINWPLTNQVSSMPTSTYLKNSPNDCKASIICKSCGKCRCKDCNKRESNDSCKFAVDCITCMCIVKPIFYHCLKDQDGEDDCSDEPCSCCSQPHCFTRWSIMALLFPCLPCLACYLPLLSCSPNQTQTGCKCTLHSSDSSTFKILLDSEVSSA